MTLLFDESGRGWRETPEWVRFMISFGRAWTLGFSERRTVALVSMPCDSAAAALITLGALVADLGNPQANDVDGHYDALLRYAHQYLTSCRTCTLPKCKPDEKRCGRIARATGQLRSTEFPRRRYLISDRTDFTKSELALRVTAGRRGKCIETPSRRYALRWHIDGEPPLRPAGHGDALSPGLYSEIAGDFAIIPENLQQAFSGLCFAGRAQGRSSARDMCASVRFRAAGEEYSLSELLTIHGWSSPGRASRVVFFNSRTARLDRQTASPLLVVADGDQSLLKVLSQPEFQRSDIIGVIDRTAQRDRLEAVGNRMLGLRQWYSADSGLAGHLASPPRGIGVLLLKKRKR